MNIEELYNELTKVQSLKIPDRQKGKEYIKLVKEYSSENKIGFEESLDHLDSYVNSLKII